MQNYNGNSEYLRLIVRAEGKSAVQFGVKISTGVLYTGTTTASSPVTVNLPTSLYTASFSYANRNKGVYVYTIGAGSISVLAINYNSGSVGDYLAYPCQDFDGGPYEYFAISTGTLASTSKSAFLLVGCEDNTTITITPTQSVSIPTDAQSTSSSLTSVSSGSNHQITLNKMQTLVVEKTGADLTGSKIVSNKPLTVVSGHECGNVPSTQTYCEHLTEQVPPTSTWGQSFLLVPFGGRNVGQYFKIVASQSSTNVSRTCNSVTLTQTLSSAGSSFTFFTSSTTYCYVASDKPVMVSQLGKGGGGDNIGDPIISILPSLDQYTNRYVFFSLNTSDFNIHQISVSVLPEYYQPSSIRLDGQPITALWSAIYNSGGTVIGFGCRKSVTGGVSHTVSHDNPRGKLSVLVHGWNSGILRGYGYLAGLSFKSPQPGNIDLLSVCLKLIYCNLQLPLSIQYMVQLIVHSSSVVSSVLAMRAHYSSAHTTHRCCALLTVMRACCVQVSTYIVNVSTKLQIFFVEPPVIYQDPQNTTVSENDTVTFNCSATGVPTPIISWYKQHTGNTLQLLTAMGSYTISSTTSGDQNVTSMLSITTAMLSDAGWYVCRASSNGAMSTSSATLTVVGKSV